ncbi:hypothetical protein [Nostoc sp. CMAA1605]|uniref:hypothetical protein n=1 Tax=Nostoc sp. CMAA1605 TaxID=2055159 RepID=UPI001F44A06A|nr:hypothetical protein [Nostoc sp. CMAA1605]MCF4970654.1 hypothetical protein [Nostoc sp. CMAA1605]
MSESKDFCFCTLAVGERYRKHTRMLAQDIQQYTPNINLCVLTDQPEDFQDFPHVIGFNHKLKSVKGYHDKRFVLDKALSLFESCMFLDSDVRILGTFVEEMNWPLGISARAGCNLLSHMQNMTNKQEIQTIEEAAKKLNIELQEVQWLHEFMFVMRRQEGLEKEFFELWQSISYFFEMRGIYHGEGFAMGLAAAKVGIDIGFFREDVLPFFKDNIEQARIKTNKSSLENKRKYFDMHREIEHPQLSLSKKVINKLTKKAEFYYRLLRLKYVVNTDTNFQNLFRI